MTEKSKKIAELMAKVPSAPTVAELPDDTPLIDVGLACVLQRTLTDVQAERTLRALRAAFPDWNELRISQIQEFQGLVQTKRPELQAQAARDVRAYLQEIFQRNHGYDLEFMRRDPVEAAKFVLQLVFVGASLAHYLLWLANRSEPPMSNAIIRVLDRLGVMKRTSSVRKAQAAIESHLPEEMRRDFAVRFGYVVERWCDAKRPTCWECVLVESCPVGRKVQREWKVQQQRLEVQRRKEEERRRKEEEKARKRIEAEAKRHARELERQRRNEERKRRQEEARRAKEEERAKRAAERAAVAAKKTAAAERAAAKKAGAARAAAGRKKTARSASKSARPRVRARAATGAKRTRRKKA